MVVERALLLIADLGRDGIDADRPELPCK